MRSHLYVWCRLVHDEKLKFRFSQAPMRALMGNAKKSSYPARRRKRSRFWLERHPDVPAEVVNP